MKRSKVHAAIAIAVLLGGCRAVLGIEDLELKKDGGTDAATDASVDNLVPGDAITTDVALDALGSECRNDSDCLRCCRDNTLLRPQFSELITKASQASCLCTAPLNTCSSECSRAGCPPSGPDSDPMTCNGCVDTTIVHRDLEPSNLFLTTAAALRSSRSWTSASPRIRRPSPTFLSPVPITSSVRRSTCPRSRCK